MTREEIIDQLANLLRQHHQGLRGVIHQEPYKGDIFRLFVEACRVGIRNRDVGYLTADAIGPMLLERGVPSVQEDKLIGEVHTMWNEWTYAWSHFPALINVHNQTAPRAT